MPPLEPGNVSPQGLSSSPFYRARNFRTVANGPSHQRGGHSQRRVGWKRLQVQLPGATGPLGGQPLLRCSGRGAANAPKPGLTRTLPETGSFLQQAVCSTVRETGTPCTPEQQCAASLARGRAGHEGQSPGPNPCPLHSEPPAQNSPPAPRDPGERLGRADAERTNEPLTISPSSSPPHCACAARAPAEPLHGSLFDSSHRGPSASPRRSARPRAPGAETPAPGERPRGRGRLLPAGYSTWVRVTGRHEAGSEHCPSAAILPGDRASPSSQWGARGAVVLTYHAGETPRTQSEADCR